ncbi:hypothetical protein NUW58_g4037 [Xylaria curta]|uniref:Uncharacterized protein n=1 Tax=Xylaria curta TaxID=42375 RepID=A0ACC1PAS6_9PEZI|nr:hypothetical protein NUW58_g4037 [Xylaria curta]
MADSEAVSTCALSPFLSLVHRSMEAWESLVGRDHTMRRRLSLAKFFIQRYKNLDELFCEGPAMFWFFQLREAFMSQKTMTKWSRERLHEYVLLPALNGFVGRNECFFVSHFWRTKEDPDPDGEYLRLNQEELRPQPWLYVWVDWTCIPQHPRSQNEEFYFLRSLNNMSGIIRNCGFMSFYPPFEPRLWILYEIAEYNLTCIGEMEATEDIKEFANHLKEMVHFGVRSTLDRHGYRCTYGPDKEFLTAWLEILVILTRLDIDIDEVRSVLDALTWHHPISILQGTIRGPLQIRPYEGTMVLNDDERYTFTPLPEHGKFSRDITTERKVASSAGSTVAQLKYLVCEVFKSIQDRDDDLVKRTGSPQQ